MRMSALLLVFAAVSAHAAETRCSPNGRICATFINIDKDDGGYAAQRITDASGRVIRDIFAPCVNALLANDGRYLVCAPRWAGDGQLEVFRINDGERIVRKPLSDFLTDNDISEFPEAPGEWTLREEDGSLQLVFPMPASFERKQTEDVVIDALTGELLTPKHDIYPPRLGELREPGEPRPWTKTVCSGKTLPFDAPRSVEMEVHGLLEDGAEPALPRYPRVARRAHISGYVNVQIVTDGTGNVCRRTTSLPFGIDSAVEEAVGAWKFRRLWKVDPTRLIQSTFSFRFTITNEDDHFIIHPRPVS